MLNDLDVIVRQFPEEYGYLRVYAIGDVHVGSPEFNEKAVRKKIEIIENDPWGVVSLCGDLADYGLKNSKTNVYLATMNPKEQQEYVYELFLPIADKMIAVVPGNHEERITKEVGLCPLYDLCVRWGASDVYRENVAITKLNFGRMCGQQMSFIGITSHGTTRNKHKKWLGGFDNADFAISGHTHTPEYSPGGRIRIDSKSATAKHVPFKEIVVDAELDIGGYGLKKEYGITPPPELQYLELSMVRENNKERTKHKVMDYHSIQI